MLKGVIIPASVPIAVALATPVAQAAIDKGFGLFSDGVHSMLLPDAPAGWHRVAVVARHPMPEAA